MLDFKGERDGKLTVAEWSQIGGLDTPYGPCSQTANPDTRQDLATRDFAWQGEEVGCYKLNYTGARKTNVRLCLFITFV
jgi:hypothetical protein